MGFMFCDLHVSLKQHFIRGYKFVEFVLCKIILCILKGISVKKKKIKKMCAYPT